jgi:uncharacterized delta-60 repeat protein
MNLTHKNKLMAYFLLMTCLIASAALPALADAGDLDPTFGQGGTLADWGGYATGAASQEDGKIVVAGRSAGIPSDFIVARYHPNGTRDLTFGNGTGRVITDLSFRDRAFGVVIQQDGKIVVGGSVVMGAESGFALIRYHPDGSLDSEFGSGNGIVVSPGPENCGQYSYGESGKITIQPDGKIVGVIGYDDWDGNCQWSGLAFRFHPDGLLDASFANNGIVLSDGEWGTGALWSVAVQPSDGKIVVVGYNFIKRLNPDGSADASFGTGGAVWIPAPVFLLSVAVQPDGKILAGGGSSEPFYDFAIYRFDASGLPDTSFGSYGVANTGIGPWGDWELALTVLPDAKILAAGEVSYESQGSYFGLVRYHTNGRLDRSFGGGDGITTIDLNGANDLPLALALDNKRRAVIVGRTNSQFALARVFLCSSVERGCLFQGKR